MVHLTLSYYYHSQVSMVVADDLAPIWCQGICNNHDDIGQLMHVRGVPPQWTSVKLSWPMAHSFKKWHILQFHLPISHIWTNCVSSKWRKYHSISQMSFCVYHKISRAGIILCIRPANERRRYNVTSSLIGWVHKLDYPCKNAQYKTRYNEGLWWTSMAVPTGLPPHGCLWQSIWLLQQNPEDN